MRPNELCPRSRQGTKGLVVNVVVVGSFAEEEEGIGIASDVVQVKVKGGDPDAPWYLRGDRARRDGDNFHSLVRTPWLALAETLGP